MAKKAIFTLFVAFVFFPFVSAQALDVETEIQTLLQQIAALQAELQKVKAPSAQIAPTSAPKAAIAGVCVSISRTLSLGASGNDVASLQRFLASDASVYPEGVASGYFGALTERAVKRFQTRHALVSDGSPSTTGYGVVGPRTRALINELGCGAIPELEVGGAMPRCVIRADRSKVPPGEPVTISWNSTNATYAVDNNAAERTELKGSAVFHPEADTTYTYSFFGSTVGTPAVCTLRIKVAGVESAPAPAPAPAPSESSSVAGGDTLTTAPSQGPAPLYVQFIFNARASLPCAARQLSIEYGDGEGAMLEANLCTTIGARSVYHLYKKTGAYTTRVYDNSACVSNLRCDKSVEVAKALVSVSGLSSCTIGSVTIPHGASRDFYNSPRALVDETCASRSLSRLCLDGTFSGDASYSYANCKEATALSCTLDGVTVANGAVRTFYSASSVASGNSCSSISQSRICADGVLDGSDTYNKANCVASPPTCTLDGVTLAHASSTTFYFAQNVPHGELCSAYGQVRTCSSGTLSGSSSYKYAICTPVSSNSCALDNIVVTDGSSASFYDSRTAPAGELCSAHVQNRTCSNGSLGGNATFIYASCTNQASCTLDGITLGQSSTTVFYSARTVPFGTTCSASSLSRTCTNGKLSGSDDYKYASCSVTAP